MHPHLRFERLDFLLHSFHCQTLLKHHGLVGFLDFYFKGSLKGTLITCLDDVAPEQLRIHAALARWRGEPLGRMECEVQLLSNVPWNFILPAWPAGSGTQDTPPAVRECGLRSPAKSP